MREKISPVGLGLVAGVIGLVLTMSPGTTVLAEDSGEPSTVTSTFHVTGMSCGGCEVGVRRTLETLDGVEEVKASHKEENAVVTYDPARVKPNDNRSSHRETRLRGLS